MSILAPRALAQGYWSTWVAWINSVEGSDRPRVLAVTAAPGVANLEREIPALDPPQLLQSLSELIHPPVGRRAADRHDDSHAGQPRWRLGRGGK
ncbi:MAG TPA: hypothetical protein VFR64_22275 [Methylomirabilota bacterium]|nr:hypothetical protein [Methylomirabilota bacterium]